MLNGKYSSVSVLNATVKEKLSFESVLAEVKSSFGFESGNILTCELAVKDRSLFL